MVINQFHSYVLKLLSRREYSQSELQEKLIAKGACKEEIDLLIDHLVDSGYQSDWRFTESFIRYHISNLRGPMRILGELRKKGISPETFSAVFENMEIDWGELLELSYYKKFKSLNDNIFDYKLKSKITKYLLYQGYELDSVVKFLSSK